MMKKLVAMIVLAAAVLAFAQQRGVRITTMDLADGTTIQLNMEDSTWQYAKSGYYEMDDDGEYVDLRVGGQNRIMWVRKDGTWTYVKTRPRAKANKQKDYPPLNVTGVGTNADLDIAMKNSITDAYNKGAAQLRKNVPAGIKDAEKILQACLRDKVKENALDQNPEHLQSKAWRYTSKISLHGYQVKEIMDCFEEQLELNAAPAPAAAPKK